VYFFTPLILAIAVLSLILSHGLFSKVKSLRQQIETRDDVAMIAPGVSKNQSMQIGVFCGEFGGFTNYLRTFLCSLCSTINWALCSRTWLSGTEKNGEDFWFYWTADDMRVLLITRIQGT